MQKDLNDLSYAHSHISVLELVSATVYGFQWIARMWGEGRVGEYVQSCKC
jgi:hypothetical protein